MDPELQKQVADFYRRAIQEGATEEQAIRLTRRFADERSGPMLPLDRTVDNPNPPGRLASFGRGVAQGATLGFADEGTAALKAGVGKLFRGDDFTDAYGREVAENRAEDQAAREAHGGMMLAGELAGSLAPALAGGAAALAGRGAARAGAGVAARTAGSTVGRLAASGAGLGALEATGRAEGALPDRLDNALGGAVVGGVTGVALPFIGKGIGKAARAFGVNVRNPTTRAADEILDALEGDPARLTARATGTAGETAMDLDEGVRALGRTANLYPHSQRGPMREFLEDRGRDQFGQVRGALEGGTGIARQGTAGIAEDIISARAQAARPLYQAAYARGQIPVSPELAQILQKPSVRMAFERAQQIAAEEGADLGQIGLAEGARSFRAPTVQAIDYIKRGLDDVLYVGKRPDGGLGPAMLHEIQNTRSALLREVDQLVPEYAAARETFAGFTAMKDALEMGRSRFHLDPPDVLAQQLSDMTPAEVEMFRRGAVDNVLHRLGNVPERNDLLKRIAHSPNDQARMQLLFDDPDAYQGFMQRMDALANQGQTSDFVLRGSQTANKQADRTAFEGEGIGSSFSLRGILDEFGGGRRVNAATEKAEALSPMLTQTDLPSLVELLEGRAGGRARQALGGEALTRAAALQGVTLSDLMFGGGAR